MHTGSKPPETLTLSPGPVQGSEARGLNNVLPLTVAAAETSVAALIVTQERQVLVLPVGVLDAETIDTCNRLLAAAGE